MKKKDQRVISAIQHDLLCELHRHEGVLIRSLEVQVDKLEFNALKDKEQDTYNDLLEMKRALNILKCYFDVTHTDDC